MHPDGSGRLPLPCCNPKRENQIDRNHPHRRAGQGPQAAQHRPRIRDASLRGFGVLPSGRKRFFVHCQHRGERVWKIVGDAEAEGV